VTINLYRCGFWTAFSQLSLVRRGREGGVLCKIAEAWQCQNQDPKVSNSLPRQKCRDPLDRRLHDFRWHGESYAAPSVIRVHTVVESARTYANALYGQSLKECFVLHTTSDTPSKLRKYEYAMCGWDEINVPSAECISENAVGFR
jgi:hypothetical protein